MVRKLKNIDLLDSLSCLLVLGLFFQYCFPSLSTLLNIVCLIVGAIALYIEISLYKLNDFICKIFIFVFMLTFANHFIIGNISLSFIMKFIFHYFPIAYWLALDSKKNTNYWLGVSLIIFAVTEIKWFLSPNNYILFAELSRNYVSIFLLVVIFVFINIQNEEKISFPVNIIISFMYLVFSIHAVGRGGILAGMLYLALTSIYVYKTNNKVKAYVHKNRKKIIYICLTIFALVFLIFRKQIFNLLFSRFVDNAAENSTYGRMQVYTAYLQMAFTNFKYLLLGVPYGEVNKSLTFITGNMHCSYLQLHACFGLFGVGFVFYRLYKTVRYLIKNHKYNNLIFMITFLFRIFTDFAICGFITDFIMLYYIILPMVVRKDRNEKRVTIKSIISKL